MNQSDLRASYNSFGHSILQRISRSGDSAVARRGLLGNLVWFGDAGQIMLSPLVTPQMTALFFLRSID
jgi:hypothetical protein